MSTADEIDEKIRAKEKAIGALGEELEDLNNKISELAARRLTVENALRIRKDELSALLLEKQAGQTRQEASAIAKKQKILYREINNDTNTTKLMDEFDRNDKNGRKIYRYLIPTNIVEIYSMGDYTDYTKCLYYWYVIQRTGINEEHGAYGLGGYTMTEFKRRESYDLSQHARKEIDAYIDQNGQPQDHTPVMVPFSRPCGLRAQRSIDRDYGQYGETNQYAFVGVILSRDPILYQSKIRWQ